ncbi:autoinducer binding domain-containing protein [Paracoccus laeviglucosivorans]|uniref:LuxR family transcriptional regulator n=1 Tax=Paracoccus laeviglucosivorans TaxID=1197861 RepID=A0A521C0M4_9RHOB|nr:autoinducer binding domain-containing protein [Paracoccus laeviglucosivorans]SMO52915.1 LuxR family transcriptional regulator [Paracoccus laeviglucosivorans]
MTFSVEAELRAISLLASAGYYMGIRIREAKADLVYNTYPPQWQQRYLAMSYKLRDPIIAWAYANNGAAHWSDIAQNDAAGVIADAARHGLVHGLVVTVGAIGARTIAGFARPDRPFSLAEAEYLQAALHRMHRHARPKAVTVRELHALRLVAAGKTYAIAAHMLGISEGALRARLTSARSRLGARTVPEAIQIARQQNII